MKRLALAIAVAFVAAVCLAPSAHAGPVAPDPAPKRATYVYPWFPETWTVNGAHVFYHPHLAGVYPTSYYSSDATAVADQQNWLLDWAKIDVAFASWWGQNQHAEQTRIPLLLNRASLNDASVSWSLYYEKEGFADVPLAEIQGDLQYILDRYGNHPSYARINGKPVLSVYNANDATTAQVCATASKWQQANAGRFYLILKVAPGYVTCNPQPNSWHQYAPSTYVQTHLPYSSAISPGFWRADEATPRLARDPDPLTPYDWAQRIKGQIASGATWQYITTWSEHGEGTAIEPADEWLKNPSTCTECPGTYVQSLHTDGNWPAAPPPPPPGGTVVLAAGDIQQPGAGNPTASLVQNTVHDAVLTLGDNQYESGTLGDFNAWWAGQWGAAAPNSKLYPVPGNHEHQSTLPSNYCAYFSGKTPQNVCAGDANRPYYSYNVGDWHFVALDSGSSSDTGDLTAASKTFLQNDLAADAHACEVVYMHHPRYSAGSHGSGPALADDWQAMKDAGVDLVLVGHDHNYQRWNHMDANGNVDATGPREFVVGTGGRSHYSASGGLTGLQVIDTNTYGVLKLTLRTTDYDWQFLPASGSFTDSGTDTCRPSPT